MTLDDRDWESYRREGFLRLGPVLDASGLASLRRRIDDIMLGRATVPGLQTQLDTGGDYDALPSPADGAPQATLAYRKLQGLERDPAFRALVQHPLFHEICAHEYGPHCAVSIFRAMVMNKPAGQGTFLPWHQDGGDVWNLDRDPIVTSWIALDDATTANGCVEVIPGSHRLGLLSRYGSTVGEADVARHCPPDRIVPLELEAGEALLLHNWLLHRSGVNRTDAPRRAFSVCYMDARTLNTLTGEGFPIVFAEPTSHTPDVHHYLRVVREENAQLRAMRAESERYARSLEAELRARRR